MERVFVFVGADGEGDGNGLEAVRVTWLEFGCFWELGLAVWVGRVVEEGTP